MFSCFLLLYVSGPVARGVCSAIFFQCGCQLCLTLSDSPASLNDHRETCRLSAPTPLVSWLLATGSVCICNRIS